MRRLLSIAVLLAAVLWMGGGMQGIAQEQSGGDAAQQTPDAPQPTPQSQPDAPQTQKKKTDKKEASSAAPAEANSSSSTKPSSTKPSSAADANPFPEDVSRRAAEADSGAADSPGSVAKSQPAKPSSAASQNPFPEDVSRRAAAAQSNPPESKAEPALPPGVSSSSSSGLGSLGAIKNPVLNTTEVTDPVRAKKDTQVGDFYLSRGDAKGAYMRYKDALTYDPTNMNAVYGLAQAAMSLKKFPEAEHNYQLYLEVIPTGGKAKQALKQLDVLAAEK